MKKMINNKIVLVLLVVVSVALYLSVFEKIAFLNGMQFKELINYPDIAATVYSVNVFGGITIFCIGENLRKKKLKKLIKIYSMLMIIVSGIVAIIMMLYM